MASTKVVLIVSNSASEIVNYSARKFLELGYKVAVTCKNNIAIGCNTRSLGQSDSKEPPVIEDYLDIEIDFGDEKQVDTIIPVVLSKFGRLDVLINNLCHHYQPLNILESDLLDDFNKALQIDLYTPARMAQLAAPLLRSSSGGGTIINIAPGTGQSSPQNFHRGIITAGLNMLTKSLANSFENQNVRCLGIVSSPDGMTKTSQAELTSHIQLSARIYDLIKFLISGDSDYVNATIIEINDK